MQVTQAFSNTGDRISIQQKNIYFAAAINGGNTISNICTA
jgi:hypothetical protein